MGWLSSHSTQLNDTAATGGTAGGCAFAAPMFDFPDMVAVCTLPGSGGNPEGSTCDMQCHSLDESLHYLGTRLADDTLKRRTRNVHLPGSLFLILPFEVDQEQCLQLLMHQGDGVKLVKRHADRFENGGLGILPDASTLARSRHFLSLCVVECSVFDVCRLRNLRRRSRQCRGATSPPRPRWTGR